MSDCDQQTSTLPVPDGTDNASLNRCPRLTLCPRPFQVTTNQIPRSKLPVEPENSLPPVLLIQAQVMEGSQNIIRHWRIRHTAEA
jgi:hypothetical protein